jgi:prepilin signal peptidase PulO-like enzyme (type II secretory pathway)
MVTLVLVAAGLLMGSFVNALVFRLHERRNWVNERSECLQCHHVLAPKDLVPVFSWLALRGKCRYCRKPIPDSPLVELAMPLLFVASYAWWPLPLEGAGLFSFVLWLVFIVGFVALAVYDLKWLLLPNVIVFPLIGLAVFQVLASWLVFDGPASHALEAGIAAAMLSGVFFSLHFFSKGKWIGFGDVKLAIILGLLAGTPAKAMLLLFLSSLIGTLIALPMVLAGKAHRKSLLPFGPLLIAATIIVVLWGTDIVGWYTNLIFGPSV